MDHKIDFLLLYENIFKILPSGNIQKLMEVCYEIVGLPILTVDIMYNLFGIAPQQKTGDYYWDYLLLHREFSTDIVVHMYDEGIMQSANEQKAPYVINWGATNANYPKIQGIIKVNDIVEGYVTMQCKTDEEITPDRMRAMEIIQDTLALFFKDNATENSMHYTYQKVFIGELFSNRIHSQKQLELWFNNVGFVPEPPYRIMTVSTRDLQEKNVLSYIRKIIQQFFPYQLALIQHNILYILQYNLNLDKNAVIAEKQFNVILTKFNAHCGTSNYFYDLLDTAAYQIQAEDALSLGRHAEKKYHIHNYSDYYLPAILAPRIEQMPRSNYISPVIVEIDRYDREHSTDFLTTLYTYISNLCDTAATANELHIHRNTLLYRVHKIEELTASSLKAPETFMHLMISFYMMNYK